MTCEAKSNPEDCQWPLCGCDAAANKAVRTLIECGWGPIPPAQDVESLRWTLKSIANANCVKGSEPQMLAMLQDMAVEALRGL